MKKTMKELDTTAHRRHKSICTVHAIFLSGEKTLLSLRKNTGYADGMYSLISGTIEANENPVKAIIREIKEEAGVKVQEEYIQYTCTITRSGEKYSYVNFFFRILQWDGNIINLEPEKCQSLEYHDINELPENTVSHIKHSFLCMKKNIHFSYMN